MEITREQAEGGTTVVRVAGRGTVHGAEALHAALVGAFAAPGEVVLDVGGVTEIDATFLQLVCAAGRSAAAADRGFRLEGAEALAGRFGAAGFHRHAEEAAAARSGHGGDTR